MFLYFQISGCIILQTGRKTDGFKVKVFTFPTFINCCLYSPSLRILYSWTQCCSLCILDRYPLISCPLNWYNSFIYFPLPLKERWITLKIRKSLVEWEFLYFSLIDYGVVKMKKYTFVHNRIYTRILSLGVKNFVGEKVLIWYYFVINMT